MDAVNTSQRGTRLSLFDFVGGALDRKQSGWATRAASGTGGSNGYTPQNDDFPALSSALGSSRTSLTPTGNHRPQPQSQQQQHQRRRSRRRPGQRSLSESDTFSPRLSGASGHGSPLGAMTIVKGLGSPISSPRYLTRSVDLAGDFPVLSISDDHPIVPADVDADLLSPRARRPLRARRNSTTDPGDDFEQYLDMVVTITGTHGTVYALSEFSGEVGVGSVPQGASAQFKVVQTREFRDSGLYSFKR